jgi:hypothetical protein
VTNAQLRSILTFWENSRFAQRGDMDPEKTSGVNSAGIVPPEPGGEQVQGDHRRLPMLLSQVEWRVQQKLFPGAERCFAEFSFGLERHLAEEDRAESTASGSPQSGRVAGADSETLRRLAARVGDAIRSRDCEGFASSVSDLREAFAAHADAEAKEPLPS